MRTTRSVLLLAALALAACTTEPKDGSGSSSCAADAGTAGSGDDAGLEFPPDAPDAGKNCEPPDLLVLLDRTMTMHFRPDGTETPQAENDATGRAKTKFGIAIEALKGVVAAYDTQVRFGLELWPRERDGCLLVKERIDMSYGAPQPRPYNPSCEQGEIKSAPGLGNGAGTAAVLDVETVPLCQTTPLGPALDFADGYLAKIRKANRAQYLALITDGADYDLSCPSPQYTDPVAKLHALAEAGHKTFVIGFGANFSSSGVDPAKMNKLACAAQTAKDFATSCMKNATSGIYEPVDSSTTATHLYLEATDRPTLDAALNSVAASLGCHTCLK